MKSLTRVLFVLAFVACAAPLRAQTGCDDSPEAPTAILALVGAAGAFVAVARARFSARR